MDVSVSDVDNDYSAPPIVIPESADLDARTIMYVQTVFWMATYVKAQAEKTGLSCDQIIEEFGVNVRRTIDPDWRPDA